MAGKSHPGMREDARIHRLCVINWFDTDECEGRGRGKLRGFKGLCAVFGAEPVCYTPVDKSKIQIFDHLVCDCSGSGLAAFKMV
ncbi:MAG: hypothetical protein ACOY6N_01350 [Pseudomonadota bacterium]